MPRLWPHFSSVCDLLGIVVLLSLPTFQLGGLGSVRVQIAGTGAIADCTKPPFCEPIPLKLGLSPTLVTLRLYGSPLLRFGLSFDRHARPELSPLKDEFARVRRAFPNMSTIQLEVDDAVELELLVTVVDVCVGAGFPSVFVGPSDAVEERPTASR